ncbi:MAG: carboxylating nicotinate-nucleotide diphosphorylase [Candidatus Omnitrophica bacterium]|nr:carboxylating nicotinate-nucleotide diphosphorylase [Candidatus Omnitrophota bacterium]
MKSNKHIDTLVAMALREDIGSGDVTTETFVPKDVTKKARIVARERGILCGCEVIRIIGKLIDKRIRVKLLKYDGMHIKNRDIIGTLQGPVYSILKAERVILNYIGYLSGISTTTSSYVKKIKGTRAKIFDTRKTTPAYRTLEKYAVTIGGGYNHRKGLYDQVLIKDNHFKAIEKNSVKDLACLIQNVRKKIPRRMKIEIEADSLMLLRKILPLHPDIILLDNMRGQTLKKALAMVNGERKRSKVKIAVEASGGINLRNVRQIAQLGVERVSIGAVTHSARSLDFSLEVI